MDPARSVKQNAIERELWLRAFETATSRTELDRPARRSVAIRSEQLLNCSADTKTIAETPGSLAVSFFFSRIARELGVSALRSFFEKQKAAMRTAVRYSIAAM